MCHLIICQIVYIQARLRTYPQFIIGFELQHAYIGVQQSASFTGGKVYLSQSVNRSYINAIVRTTDMPVNDISFKYLIAICILKRL